MEKFIIETQRLSLRPHQYDDVSFMIELNSDPEVTRYTGDGSVDEEQAREIVSRLLTQFKEKNIGRFITIEKATGEKVGWCGLAFLKDRGVIDLGYRFLRSKWGLGYATESGRACLRYGFETLYFNEITARVDARNLSSIHVLKKLGMHESELRRDEDGEFYDFNISSQQFFENTSK